MRSLPLLLLAIALPLPVSAQEMAPPTDTALAGITTRGRLLAAYDRAAWHATDAVRARMATPVGIEGFLATQSTAGKWEVLFGRMNTARDTLFVAARATEGSAPDQFSVEIPVRPTVGSAVERAAFRAIRTAGDDLTASPRAFGGTYNSYVLPQPDGKWLVYFLPGQRQAGVHLHGADYRYLVSADGGTIVDKLQMHRSVLNLHLPDGAIAGTHTVVIGNLPHDTDVFLVLSRKPVRPEIVVTEHFTYEIKTDGSIAWSRSVRAGER